MSSPVFKEVLSGFLRKFARPTPLCWHSLFRFGSPSFHAFLLFVSWRLRWFHFLARIFSQIPTAASLFCMYARRQEPVLKKPRAWWIWLRAAFAKRFHPPKWIISSIRLVFPTATSTTYIAAPA